MDNQQSSGQPGTKRPGSQLWLGLLVLGIGFALLLHRLDFWIFPGWLFSWPVLVIAIGLIVGARKNFSGTGWLILVLVGTFFLLDDITGYHWHLYNFGLPVGVIIIGLFLLFRGLTNPVRTYPPPKREFAETRTSFRADDPASAGKKPDPFRNGEDYLDLTTVFGSIKKRVFSKDFLGGQTFTLFGGTELDFTQADINGRVVLDVTQIFGGVTLVVPANWAVKADVVAILGGINDKRSHGISDGDEKVLILTGACIFGGVEIKSY